MTQIRNMYLLLLLVIILSGCKQSSGKDQGKPSNQSGSTGKSTGTVFKKGTFGYDKKFLQDNYKNTIILERDDNKSMLILSPELQGRVMTSTLNGEVGMSFGWLNYNLIKSKEIKEHINPTGGEERFWLGPEGGQYSLYFKQGLSFDFENWYVPAVLDTETFDVTEQNKNNATFHKEIRLKNYAGTNFHMDITRRITLLHKSQIKESFQLEGDDFLVVGYKTMNTVKNIGDMDWKKEKGLVSIWLLSMLNSSSETTVVVPVKQGGEKQRGSIVNDNYFGKIAPERLKKTSKTIYFKADGNSRGKIGISPKRTTGFMGSYDAKNKVLTVIEISEPKKNDFYVNSVWELQKYPYAGDVLNSYNDGKLDDGSQMGPFYELESSSPALELLVGESYQHVQKIYHFKGSKEILNTISLKVFDVSIDEIENAFQ